MKRLLGVMLFALLLLGCGGGGGGSGGTYTTREEETGYKGKAKIDPYLAAARFLQRFGYQTVNSPGWRKLDPSTSTLIVPAGVLETKGFLHEADDWIFQGGHLVCLVEHSGNFNDWNDVHLPAGKEMPEELQKWLTEKGLTVENPSDDLSAAKIDTHEIRVNSRAYKTFAESSYPLNAGGGKKNLFGSRSYGSGRISVVSDARVFRNRYIDTDENAAMLLALVDWSPREGGVVAIIRNAELSFWKMLWDRGMPALLGLAALTLWWLWKNMPSFGPKLAPEEPSNLRAYDHHLEALGDFHWRLDRAAGLLKPLRDSVLERAQQQMAATGRHSEENLFEWLGQFSSLPADRVQRAMTHENPSDAQTFTRLIADLQTLHLSLP